MIDPFTLCISAALVIAGTLFTKLSMGNPRSLLNAVMNKALNETKRVVFKRAIKIQFGLLVVIGLIGLIFSKYILLFSVGCFMYYSLFVIPRIRECMAILDGFDKIVDIMMAKIMELDSDESSESDPPQFLFLDLSKKEDMDKYMELQKLNTITDEEKDKDVNQK